MSELVDWTMDLAGHEQARLAAHLTASIADLDLLAVYSDECRAARMLYSGLDPVQRAIYAQLEQAGILGAS